MQNAVNAYGCAHAHTCLHLPLDTKTDPDDAYSTIAYEKGFNLLCHLEKLVGGEAVMDVYLKAHVQRFAHKSLSSDEWVAFFLEYFRALGTVDAAALDAIDWKAWLHTPGMPKEFEFDASLADASRALAARWADVLHGRIAVADAKFSAADIAAWKSPQTVVRAHLSARFMQFVLCSQHVRRRHLCFFFSFFCCSIRITCARCSSRRSRMCRRRPRRPASI